MQGSGFNRTGYSDSDKKRRAGIKPVCCYAVQYDADDTFITVAGHKHHSLSRKGTSTPCKICIDTAFVAIGDNIPEQSRSSRACVAACVVFIEDFYGIRAKRCFCSGFYDGVMKYFVQLIDERKAASAFYSELHESGILA